MFKNIVFRSVALVKKKLWAILDFFSQTGLFFRPVPYPINKKYVFLAKNSLNYYSLKVTKFHGDNVKNESTRTKNYMGGAPNAPPPACLGLINTPGFEALFYRFLHLFNQKK